MNRRTIFIIIAVILAGGGGYLWYSGQNGAETAETAETTETVETFIGDLDATATASGQLEAQVKANLSLNQSGDVAEVLVQIGDRVTAGDTLLVLDTADLERAVLNAEQTLLIQQNNLAELTTEATEIEILAAEANVSKAEIQLADILDGGTQEEIIAQEASIRAAQSDVAAASARLSSAQSGGNADELLAAQTALTEAQEAYTQAEEQHRSTYDCTWNESSESFDCDPESDDENARANAQQALANLRAAEQRIADLQPGGDTFSVASASASLGSAQASLRIEEARLAQLMGDPDGSSIATAEASLARAQQQLETLMDGAEESQVVQQEVLVAQAEIALARAQKNLADATLYAPFDGLITAVDVNIGEMANGILIELVSEDSLEVVLDVDEIDLSSLSIGQAAIVTFETYPNVDIPAQVVAIAPENTANNSGTVVYDVNLALDTTDLLLLEGMTADAQLITDQRENVLLLSNEAISIDRSTDTYTVDIVTGRDEAGNLLIEETEVTIGLRDGNFTQITGGIDEGVEVAVGYNPPPTRSFGPPGNND